MKPVLRFEWPTVILLLLLSLVMSAAIAGNNLLVSPGVLKQPAVKVTPQPAQMYHYRAVTRAPVRKSGRVQAGSLGWQCQGDGCTISGPWPVPAVSACRALAGQVGPIRSYGHAKKKLGTNELVQCNAGLTVKAPQAKAPVAAPGGAPAGRPIRSVAPALNPPAQPKLNGPATPTVGRQPPRLSPTLATANQDRAAESIAGKSVRSVTPIPVPGVTQPVGHNQGFAPSQLTGTKRHGLNKPVMGPGGKPLLPPQVTAGERHLMMGDAPAAPGGGFVPSPSPRVNIPVTAPGGGSLLPESHGYLLRADTEIIDPISGGVLREVDPRQAVVVRVTVHNVGTARSPRFMLGSRRYGEHGPIDGLEPGGTYQIGFRDGVGEDHQSNDHRYWFAGSYTLRSTDATPLRVTRSASTAGMRVPVRGIPELAVTEISDIRLYMTGTPLDPGVRGRLHGHLSSGLDEYVNARVTIENYGNAPSSATSLSLKLESTGIAIAPRTDSSLTNTGSTSGNGAPSGTLTYDMPIPAIPAYGSITRDIRFNHVLHELWDRDIRTSQGLGLRHSHQHIPEAAGAYACGRENWSHYQGWQGSSFRITAALPETEEMRVAVKLAGGRFSVSQDRVSCGVEG